MNQLYKYFTGLNVMIYKLSKGRLGNKLGRQSVLLLRTQGNKSGKTRLTTLSYYRDGDNYIVVGSNWGKETQPGWFHNLAKQPRATIRVGTKIMDVVAHPGEGDEYQRLWELVTQKNAQYIDYQRNLKRRIPIVILVPSASI